MSKKTRTLGMVILMVCFGCMFTQVAKAQQNAGGGRIEVGGHAGAAFDLFGSRPVPTFARSLLCTGTTTPPSTQGCPPGISTFPPGAYLSNISFADGHERRVNPTLGGGALFSLTKNIWAYGDFEWVPKYERTATAQGIAGGSWSETSSRYYTNGFGGLQFTLPTVTRVVPYFLIGGGVVHFSQTAHNTVSAVGGVCSDGTGTCTNDVRTGNPNDDPKLSGTFTTGAAHYGGGIRYFVKENWGIRAGAEGFYTKEALTQRLSFPFVPDAVQNGPALRSVAKRHGFGQVTVGIFREFR